MQICPTLKKRNVFGAQTKSEAGARPSGRFIVRAFLAVRKFRDVRDRARRKRRQRRAPFARLATTLIRCISKAEHGARRIMTTCCFGPSSVDTESQSKHFSDVDTVYNAYNPTLT